MFIKNRANIVREILLEFKMSFQLKLNLIIGVTCLRVIPLIKYVKHAYDGFSTSLKYKTGVSISNGGVK